MSIYICVLQRCVTHRCRRRGRDRDAQLFADGYRIREAWSLLALHTQRRHVRTRIVWPCTPFIESLFTRLSTFINVYTSKLYSLNSHMLLLFFTIYQSLPVLNKNTMFLIYIVYRRVNFVIAWGIRIKKRGRVREYLYLYLLLSSRHFIFQCLHYNIDSPSTAIDSHFRIWNCRIFFLTL